MVKVLLFTLLLPVFTVTGLAFSEEGYRRTPYGDFCISCSTYGVGDKLVPEEESRAAIEQYYRERDLEIGAMKSRGRFIEFEIRKNGAVLDKVLFDRKTGRIRSIY
jgi:hypothetical protein